MGAASATTAANAIQTALAPAMKNLKDVRICASLDEWNAGAPGASGGSINTPGPWEFRSRTRAAVTQETAYLYNYVGDSGGTNYPTNVAKWGENIDANSIEQMERACQLPIAVRGALMPDAHLGYGLDLFDAPAENPGEIQVAQGQGSLGAGAEVGQLEHLLDFGGQSAAPCRDAPGDRCGLIGQLPAVTVQQQLRIGVDRGEGGFELVRGGQHMS